MSRRLELTLITLLLLIAAALRITDLTRLPPGLSSEEITMTYISEATRSGELPIASLYNVGDGGREGLYPFFQSLITGILGDGLLPYRMFSLGCGLLTVALTYALAKRLFGWLAGFTAMAAMTVTLWPIILSRLAIREALLLPLAISILLALSAAIHLKQVIRTAPPLTTSYAVLGVLIAASSYTHWTGLLWIPLLVLFILYLSASRQPVSRRVLGHSSFTFLIILILGTPYLIFTVRAFELSGFNHWLAVRPPDIGSFIGDALRTLVSFLLRGDPSAAHNIPGAPLIGPLGIVLFLVGFVQAVIKWRHPAMMLMLLTLGLGLWADVWSTGAPDFTHSIIALPAVMVLIGVGAKTAAQFLRSSLRVYSLAEGIILGITMAGIFLSILFGADTLRQRWAQRPEVYDAFNGRLGDVAIYLDRTANNQDTSICTFRLDAASLTPRESDGVDDQIPDPVLLSWMMHRKAPNLRFSNCISGLVLTAGGAPQRVAFVDPKARTLVSPVVNPWLSDLKPISTGRSATELFEVDARKAVEDTFGMMNLSHVMWAPEARGKSPQPTLPIRMGGYLTFEGYEMAPGPYKPGDTISLATYWRADGRQIPGLRLFVHILRNPMAQPVLQTDMLSIDPTLLQDRDVFVQLHFIPIPADFPAGDYMISVGAYSTISGDRLPVYDQDQERGNRLFLDKIEVVQR